jgi:hypothetical protein
MTGDTTAPPMNEQLVRWDVNAAKLQAGQRCDKSDSVIKAILIKRFCDKSDFVIKAIL